MSSNHGGERDELAPVIPLFGARADERAPKAAEAPGAGWHPTWIGEADRASGDRLIDRDDDDTVAAAERLLLRRLRTRSLSVREARSLLVSDGCDDGVVDAVEQRFTALGYLDDHALAEQLIDKALSRKAQGRQAVAQVLAQRGIPRDVADEALAQLPTDEAERALEFARSKAPLLADLDRDAALRRLAGQLARRGFGSSALSAARTALEEQSSSARGRGVRFD
ncbi:regulatory protein RecX [Microbacterium sp. NPDC091313]